MLRIFKSARKGDDGIRLSFSIAAAPGRVILDTGSNKWTDMVYGDLTPDDARTLAADLISMANIADEAARADYRDWRTEKYRNAFHR